MAPSRAPVPSLDALGGSDPLERAAAAATLGLRGRRPRGTAAALLAAVDDPDPRVRAAALGALVRARAPARARTAWRRSVQDPDASVRRRAAECAPALASHFDDDDRERLLALLDDAEPLVAESAAHALGELGRDAAARAVEALALVATAHADALVREAAVAALGAIGDPVGLGAVLAACRDKPAVRRRAVVALAAFEGPEVEAALARALEDRDWQVRQVAEDLQPDQLR